MPFSRRMSALGGLVCLVAGEEMRGQGGVWAAGGRWERVCGGGTQLPSQPTAISPSDFFFSISPAPGLALPNGHTAAFAPSTAARSLRQADGEVIIIRGDSGGPGMMMAPAIRGASGGPGMMMAPACTGPTAATLIASSARLSILSEAIEADPSLAALLDNPGTATPLTLFAPTDAAWMTFFDTLGVSRKAGLAHPTTAAALRFLILPNTSRPLRSFAPQAKALTAVGANLTVLSPEAVANYARALAAQAQAQARAGNGTQEAGGQGGPSAASSSSAFFAAIAPLLAPVASAITSNGTDPDGTAFLAAIAGLAGSLVHAITPGTARRRVPRLCEDGCRWTVAGPLTGGSGASADGRDAATNNATVLLGNGRACGSTVHVIDEVLLPELLGTSGEEGEVRIVSVGDGAGRLVSRVSVPPAGSGRNTSVELLAGGATGGAPAAAPPAAPASATAPAPAPALSRRVNPEPVDIINPVIADLVGKQPDKKAGPPPPAAAPEEKESATAAAPAATAPPKKAPAAVTAPPAPAPTLPAVPEDTLIEVGPQAIPPAGA